MFALRLVLLFLCCFLFTSCAPRRSSPEPSTPRPAQIADDPVPADFTAQLERVNEARRTGFDCGEKGVFASADPLTWNDKLAAAAQKHTRNMLENNFFSHADPAGNTPSVRVEREGYAWALTGENLAYATPGNFTPTSVVDAWLGSPGHCAVLMDAEFREMGAAMLTGELEFWTQVFAAPQ